MKFITRTFVRGLAVVLPLAITAYVLYWLGSSAESYLGPRLRKLFPDIRYVFGMGIAAGLLLIFVVGMLARVWLVRQLGQLLDAVLERVPLVRTLYSSTRDLMSLFGSSGTENLGQVVSVTFPGTEFSLLGFVTREDVSQISGCATKSERVAVYLPLSYQIGGYTLMLPRTALTPVDMTVEECLQFTMTAGVTRQGRRALPVE